MNGSGGWHFDFYGTPAGFGQPAMLWLLLPAVLLSGWAFWSATRRASVLGLWVGKRFQAQLLPERSRWRPAAKALLGAGGLVLLSLALARPHLGGTEETLKRRGIDVVVALDASHSMLASDVAPTRIARARLELETLLQQLGGDRIGLVAFASDAFVQMPLSSDYAAAQLFLRAIEPSQMPQGGTDVGGALRRSLEVLENADKGATTRVVILLSDGEDWHGDALTAAKELEEKGVTLYAVGIGSEGGSPVPMVGDSGEVVGYRKDAQGNPLLTRLDAKGLQTIARAAGGEYFHQPSGVAMGAVSERIAGFQKSELEERRVMTYSERYQWLALPGLALLLAGAALRPSRRTRASGRSPLRSAGGAVAAAMLLLLAMPAQAASLLEADEPATRKGLESYKAGDFAGALQAFEAAAARAPKDPIVQFNRGSALHKLGRLEEAAQAFDQASSRASALGADGLYNLGTAQAAQKNEAQAIATYRQALLQDPDHALARHNLEVLLKQKQEKEKEQQAGQGAEEKPESQSGEGQKQADAQPQKEGKDPGPDGQGQQQADAQPQKEGKDPGPDGQGQQQAQSQGAEPSDEMAAAETGAPVREEPTRGEQVLDAMRMNEKSLQSWRFQKTEPRRNDEKPW